MNMKKALSAMLAASMALSFASVGAFAASANTSADKTGTITPDATEVVDGDGNSYNAKSGVTVTPSSGKVVIDTVTPNSTIYIRLDGNTAISNGRLNPATGADLANDKLFSFSSTKKTNSKLVKSIEVVTNKAIGSVSGRNNWLKITLNDGTMTSEQKFEGTVTFKAKKTSDSEGLHNGFSGDVAYLGDTYTLDLSIWVNNSKITDGDNPGTGDRVYFDPTANDTNTLIWGDDRASLKFEAGSNPDKFYARLSTKADMNIYSEYGDPLNADLYFYDFVGNPTVPSTSRAVLTLGVPWDLDAAYVPDPEKCYIYQVINGELVDVTNQFTYSEDEQEIAGWSIKTRQLGTYIVSDTELDLEIADEDSAPSDSDKDVPDTGANDMVNVAMLAGMLSLAAAGAVAFKRTK